MIAAVPAALAVTGAAINAQQANEQNKAVKRSVRAAENAAEVTKTQIDASTDAEQQRRQRETNRIRGRIRVAFAGSGFSDGAEPFLTQTDIDQNIAGQAAATNRDMAISRVESDRDVQITNFQSRHMNPVLSALTGGLQGLQAGLAITSAVQAISAATAAPAATPAGVYGPEISADTFYSKIKGGAIA